MQDGEKSYGPNVDRYKVTVEHIESPSPGYGHCRLNIRRLTCVVDGHIVQVFSNADVKVFCGLYFHDVPVSRRIYLEGERPPDDCCPSCLTAMVVEKLIQSE